MRSRDHGVTRKDFFIILVWYCSIPLIFTGCKVTPSRENSPSPLDPLGSAGRLVEAKRCSLSVVILTRPQGDPLLNETVWKSTDEQVVDPELRRALQLNGMRLGRLTGELPSGLAELLQAKPPNQPDVLTIANPSGESTLIDASQATPKSSLNLLLSAPDGQVRGKNYSDAKGFLRVTASHEGTTAVALKLVPELHHGPVLASFIPVPMGGVMMPREFQMSSGQKQETFKDLATTISLQPGQVLLIGARADRTGSLGDILFDKPDGNSDRVKQSLVMIWATRNKSIDLEAASLNFPPALLPFDDATLKSIDEPNSRSTPAKPVSELAPAISEQDQVLLRAGSTETQEVSEPLEIPEPAQIKPVQSNTTPRGN